MHTSKYICLTSFYEEKQYEIWCSSVSYRLPKLRGKNYGIAVKKLLGLGTAVCQNWS